MDWLDEPFGDPYSPGGLVTCQSCGYEVPDTEVESDFFARCRECVNQGKRTNWVPPNCCLACRRQLPDSGRVEHVCVTCRPLVKRQTVLGQEVYVIPTMPQSITITASIRF